ncbi:MAG: T9SS type A sorting domain-containing protein [Bacteroidia bacterium]|nr:T9SS type A sorting domain-containing protein [Bacteroidia bacterium]
MKKIILFCISLFIVFHLTAQPVWQWQNPNPPMSNLASISMIDSTEGWLTVGANSLMHYTGGQWNMYYLPNSLGAIYPTSVYFTAHNNGWLGCSSGIYRYNGLTWHRYVAFGTTKMCVVSPSNIWITGGNWGKVYNIIGDGIVVDTIITDSISSRKLNSLCFPDSLHGWAVGDSGTVISYYSGIWYTWPAITTRNLYDVHFTDMYNGWAVGDSGTILYYNGINWQIQNSGINFKLRTVDFTDPLHGFAAGFGDTIISYNGTSWSNYSTGLGYVLSLDMVTPSRGFASCYGGKILNIMNGNTTEYPSTNITQNELMGMSFTDKDHGWCVGYNGTMLKFLNGHWSLLPQITNASLYSVHFPTIDRGWCVGQYGIIEAYQNGNWYGQFVDSLTNLYGVYFVDSLNGWAVGQDGLIMRYQNHTWQPQVSNTNSSLLSVYFTDTTNGWAVGAYGTIIHYNNGLWQNYNNSDSTWLNSVCFTSPNDGWAVGDSGMIMHYNGSGWQVNSTVWNADSTSVFFPWKILRSVSFTAPNNGWAVGMQSLFHYDGSQWYDYSYTLPSEYCYTTIVWPDDLNGWISGPYGNINYCYKPEFLVTNMFATPEEKVIYSDVYPNPCDVRCYLKLENKNNEKIKVKVCGLSGQELQVKYEIENINDETNIAFDVSKLYPGLYFITIETNSKTIVRKIIKSK